MMWLWLLGCGRPDCEATVADIHTVVDVAWKTPEGGRSWVEYDAGDGPQTTPAIEDSPRHNVSLFGLLPLTDVAWTAHTESGGKSWQCEGVTRTGNLPADLPTLTVTASEDSLQSSEAYFLGSALGAKNALFVIDRQGRWRWASPGAGNLSRPDVEFVRDTNNVVVNQADSNREEDVSRLLQIRVNGELGPNIPTSNAHHMFAQGPDGAYAWLKIDVRDWLNPETDEIETLVGDAVVETTADGSERELFNTWGEFTPVPDESWDTEFYPQGLDWTHANGINWYPDRNSYLVSFGNNRIVVEIDRDTGEIIRQFSGPGGYTFAEGTHPFHHEHDPRFLPNGHLMLITTDKGPPNVSGVVEYAIDDDTQTLKEVWSYGFEAGIDSKALGQGIRLENGNTLVNYGATGIMREVTPDGQVAWELSSGTGSWFGQIVPFDNPAAPVTK